MALARRICMLEQTMRRTRTALPTGFRHYSFLPSSYHLDESWQKRLDSSLVKQIRLEQFYAELQKKFELEKTGSALDIDIFASAIQGTEHLDQLEDLLSWLRSSSTTVDTRRSTCNAVVRSFLDLEKYEDLMKILADKGKFGMFLDYYTANLMMDKFIQLQRFSDAARVAIDLMFQEDFGSALTRELALYSCLIFLKDADWASLLPLDSRQPAEDTGEEILVYVSYLKNEFFDDHFDLKDPKHRVGKTLYLAGRTKDDLLGRSAQVLGLGLYQKWHQGVALLEKFAAASADATIVGEVVQSFLQDLQQQTENPDEAKAAEMKNLLARVEAAKKKLQDTGKLMEKSLLEISENQVKEAVKSSADLEAAKQEKLYEEWIAYRETEVSRQIRRFEIYERLRALRLKRQQLNSEEELLFFFERKNKWEKMLSPKARQAMAEQQELDGSFYDYRVEDPRYEIPQIKTPQPYTTFAWWRKTQEQYENNLKFLAK